MTGDVIGRHQGLFNYTVGQRQGIKVGAGGPYYVVKKDLKKNVLYVTNDPNDKALQTKKIEIHSVNWITPSTPLFCKEGEFLGRYRHQGSLVPLTINQIDKAHYYVVFKKPQQALASGQGLVLYKGKVCLGGGVIV